MRCVKTYCTCKIQNAAIYFYITHNTIGHSPHSTIKGVSTSTFFFNEPTNFSLKLYHVVISYAGRVLIGCFFLGAVIYVVCKIEAR